MKSFKEFAIESDLFEIIQEAAILSKQQISSLSKAYAHLEDKPRPDSPAIKKMQDLLSKLDKAAIKQIVDANIRIVSAEAKTFL